ncbi:hypothetical protein HTV45_09505 [Streptomyces sp. CHD11]|uniref:hypothetical protein n=1 Tax=Streptomyces sp. CHD11 TaxID=2741325 RepID=UPI001BFCABF9|nr:hypothetical protein [Streptomyces sp. CHD11]MBT3151121.1 hypothetical protein [Streptomyces sp. CHD11]
MSGGTMGLWVRLPPEDGEEVLCVKTGAVLVPGTELALVGGILVLTNRRLYHGPLDTRLLGQWLARFVDAAGPAGGGELIDLFVNWTNKARTVPLSSVSSVTAIRTSSMRVTTLDGKHRVFGVAADWKAPVWSRRNPPHRDEMRAAVLRAVEAARRQ